MQSRYRLSGVSCRFVQGSELGGKILRVLRGHKRNLKRLCSKMRSTNLHNGVYENVTLYVFAAERMKISQTKIWEKPDRFQRVCHRVCDF